MYTTTKPDDIVANFYLIFFFSFSHIRFFFLIFKKELCPGLGPSGSQGNFECKQAKPKQRGR